MYGRKKKYLFADWELYDSYSLSKGLYIGIQKPNFNKENTKLAPKDFFTTLTSNV